MLKETLADIEDHYTTSKDEDARVGHKSEDNSFFGYKPHIVMSNERIITAATVTSRDKDDGPQLPELIEQSRTNGMEVESVVGDTVYNIIFAQDEEKGLELVAKLHPPISDGTRKEENKFDLNKDAGMFVCPAGHMANRKACQGKKIQGQNQPMVYYFYTNKYKTCSRKQGCYKEGVKSKTYSIQIKSGEHQQQSDFQETKLFREKSRVRYKIEAKNSKLKNVFGYDRATSYGLSCMRIQGALTIFVTNYQENPQINLRKNNLPIGLCNIL